MSAMVLEDAREFIFPIFSVEGTDERVYMDTRTFLGTAFFVTKRGDAVTANHIIPKPDDMKPGRRLVAVVHSGSEQQVCWITHAASFEECDLALIHVNLPQTKYLEISEEQVFGGTDVQLIGIPSHEVWQSGKEMRIFKGYVSLGSNYLEINLPIPAGMSGCPVFSGTKVVAWAVGSIRTEEIEDYVEEEETLSDMREQIRITKGSRITHYGLAYPFSRLRGEESPVFGGMTLFSLIQSRNA